MSVSVCLTILFAFGFGSGRSEGASRINTVRSQHEAGETTISVISVLPWDEVKSQMLPKFDFNATKALDEVVPNTASIEESYLHSIAAALKAKFPGTSFSSTITKIQDATDEVPKVSKKEEETTKSGEIPEAPALPDLGKRVDPGTRPEGLKRVDPMLKFQAANALNQEVQMLNAYLNGAKPKGYTAYVVRLQISTLPYARNQPYDLYASVSFTPEGTAAGGPGPWQMQDQRAVQPTLPLLVVPLLVTDNLEATLRAKSEEQIRQFSLGLAALLQGVGLDFEFKSLSDRLTKIFGTDINALLTVGQVAPNTVRIRLGAMNQPDARWAMIPRNHFVTVLLLTPSGISDDSVFRGVAQTELRDTRNGRLVPDRYASTVESRAREIFKDFGLMPRKPISNAEAARQLTAPIELGKPEELPQKIDKYLKRRDDSAFEDGDLKNIARHIAPYIVSLRLNSSYRQFQVRLPEIPKAKLPSPDTLAFIKDNTKSGATVTLGGGQRLDVGQDLSVSLLVPNPPNNIVLPAQSFAVGADRSTLTASFPSVGVWFTAQEMASARIRVATANAGTQDYQTRIRTPGDPDPASSKWQLRSTTSWLVADASGHGRAEVILVKGNNAPQTPFVLQIDGASIEGLTHVAGANPTSTPQGIKVSDSTRLLLVLGNLIPGLPVTFSGAEDENLKPVTRSLNILAVPPSEHVE